MKPNQKPKLTSRDVKYFDLYLYFLFITEVYVNFTPLAWFSYFRGIVIVVYTLWLFFTTLNPVKNGAVFVLLIFIVLSAMLSFFSINQFKSLYNFSRILPSLLIFPIVVNFFDYEKTKYILQTFASMIIFISIYLILASFMGIGSAGYATGDSFTRGGLNSATQLYITIVSPALLFLDFISKRKKQLIAVAMFISMIFLIIGMKRTTIALIIISMVIYFIYMKGPYRLKYLYFLVLGTLFLLISSPYWYSTFEKRYEHRAHLMTTDAQVVQQEGRTIEFKAVINEVFSFNDPGFSLFGRSAFETPGQYGWLPNYNFGLKRPIHNDFAMLLNSLGLVGFSTYLLFLWLVFKRLVKYWKFKHLIQYGNILFVVYLVIFITSFLNMYNGSFYGTGNRTIVMFFLGLMFVEPLFKKDYLLGRSRN